MIMTTIQMSCDKILDLLGWGEKEKYFWLQKCLNYKLSKFYFFQIHNGGVLQVSVVAHAPAGG